MTSNELITVLIEKYRTGYQVEKVTDISKWKILDHKTKKVFLDIYEIDSLIEQGLVESDTGKMIPYYDQKHTHDK